jgi:3-methyl-2-oxobutanoate hydroxymethyltransferase
MANRKVNILDLQTMADNGEPITMLTAYDYSSASLVDAAEIDMILVGDSLGMVVLGYDSTVPVSMEEMIHHCKAVARGAKHAFLVGDMPFMSYQVEISDAVRNAGRFLKEAGMDSVKLEGGQEIVPTIEAILAAGIPVMGHIGLTPQSQSKLGGYRVQGRTAASALKLLDDALALEAAGCFSIVLEAVPATVAQVISRRLHIPTIGIGAGAACDGQVLVFHDLLGLYDRLQPRFVKEYASLRQTIIDAFIAYSQDVRASRFPAEEHTYAMKAEEEAAFMGLLVD